MQLLKKSSRKDFKVVKFAVPCFVVKQSFNPRCTKSDWENSHGSQSPVQDLNLLIGL